jgi:hypothetical protein
MERQVEKDRKEETIGEYKLILDGFRVFLNSVKCHPSKMKITTLNKEIQQ